METDRDESRLPQVGDTVTLRDDAIRARCMAGKGPGNPCGSWSFTSQSTATSADGLTADLTVPSSPVEPRVIINGPERVGNCDDFPLS